VVKKLINDAGRGQIVCAMDAGREGENIFRLIYEHAHCRKPVQRLWISSLTDEAISEGFRQLRPGSAFDDLGQAARARAQADWLVGMNLTRAYTVHNKVLCTIGRVQTPTLAMIVGRDEWIASFRKAFSYELVAAPLEEGFSAKYSHQGQTRIDNKAKAERQHRETPPPPHRLGAQGRKQDPPQPPAGPLRSDRPAAGRQPALWVHCRPGARVCPGALRDPQADQLSAHR
jgi:DNA topoisomerase-3